uniref:Uncharacterized protein n=1 Tax=Branchiostoma floridae TaxID=7739 RepID=C3Y8Q0_BRAFL|eukprot:XP_002607477.1 hypothetical protein BRAFLDRAFT_69909 [Branchiostoma floridae]
MHHCSKYHKDDHSLNRHMNRPTEGHDRHWTDTFSDSDHDEEAVVVPEIEPHKLHPELAKLEPQTCQRYKLSDHETLRHVFKAYVGDVARFLEQDDRYFSEYDVRVNRKLDSRDSDVHNLVENMLDGFEDTAFTYRKNVSESMEHSVEKTQQMYPT